MRIGELAPEFNLQSQNGDWISLSTLLSKGPIVLFFYPKDDSYGCTLEVCEFRDQHAEFLQEGAQVVGISRDSVQSHAQFVERQRLPFWLLSDPSGTVRKAYGVPNTLFGLIPGRVTFVIDQQGTIRLVFDSMMNFRKHVIEAKRCLQGLGRV